MLCWALSGWGPPKTGLSSWSAYRILTLSSNQMGSRLGIPDSWGPGLDQAPRGSFLEPPIFLRHPERRAPGWSCRPHAGPLISAGAPLLCHDAELKRKSWRWGWGRVEVPSIPQAAGREREPTRANRQDARRPSSESFFFFEPRGGKK